VAEYARNRYLNVRVISKSITEGSFVGEDVTTETIYRNLRISDYYFYDFC